MKLYTVKLHNSEGYDLCGVATSPAKAKEIVDYTVGVLKQRYRSIRPSPDYACIEVEEIEPDVPSDRPVWPSVWFTHSGKKEPQKRHGSGDLFPDPYLDL